MKVLEIFGEPVMSGGQEAFVFEVLKNMNREGLQIDCLTAYDWVNEGYRKLLEECGGSAYELNLPFQPGKSRMNIADPLRKFFLAHRYDVVHVHSGSISVLAIVAGVADKAGVTRVIVHSHCTGENDNFKHKVLRFAASLSMKKHVHKYCACSKVAADWKFAEQYAKQAVIIKNGIDVEKFRFDAARRKEYRAKLGVQDDTYVIGHVGRFSHQKNQLFLLKIFYETVKLMPNSKLLLVGDGEDKDKIVTEIKGMRISSKVILTGNVKNVQDYLQAMDVFVFPSNFEGFGIAVLEAQCSGLPVVTADTVTEEVNVTNDVVFLSLGKATHADWAGEILKYRNYKRQDNADVILRQGYDIKNTADKIRKLYLEDV